ncbi:pif1 protein [Moniliophthora roreri MCA 2997]|uniref:ATP-dependent DNA helicase n=1 Tax=Moniliophthora roreri (strain MCA 2997) TaxID=1381753 RepID=V2WJ84_MONRO|nr:pif1 protein [Moniliophthora roreri MCA 2997]
MQDVQAGTFPVISIQRCKQWMKEIKFQENVIQTHRCNQLNIEQSSAPLPSTECTASFTDFGKSSSSSNLPKTEAHLPTFGSGNVQEVIEHFADEWKLNMQQRKVYNIILQHFIKTHLCQQSDVPPLRMMLTGPEGTGKMHSVKAVYAAMSYFGFSHILCFLAPTGSAACLIDGQTIHKGLKISIQKSSSARCTTADDISDIHLTMSHKNHLEIRKEWSNVTYTFADEISMVPQTLLAEIDAVLCFAKEKPEAYFGDINIVLAGDFLQLPPVFGTPLDPYPKSNDKETMKHFG